MKNLDSWAPSKFVYRNGQLRASRNPRQVGFGSRVMADSIARSYAKHLPAFARGRLIDLGCGRIPLYDAYRGLITSHVCADWVNSLHRNEHLDVECDLTAPLPFESGDFDTVILSDVLEHIPEPTLLWDEMARLLRPGGHILMNVPFLYWLHEQPFDFYRYTEHALRRFVQGAGLSVALLEAIGGAPEVLSDIIAKSLIPVPVFGPTLARTVQWSTAAFVATKFGAKVSRSSAEEFPLGYFMVAKKAEILPTQSEALAVG